MIIKRIIEYSENGIEERYHLISSERDEGWDMSKEEFELMIGLGITAMDVVSDAVVKAKEAISSILANFRKNMQLPEDQAEDCPDYIEPPESTETVENVQKEVENEPKQAEKVQKEGKKTQKRAVRDFSKYIEMANNDCSRRMILDSMIKDFGVSESTAVTYYHTKIRTKPLPQKMMVKDPILKEEIAALPDYGSYTDFKDALARTDVGRGRYTVKALKTMYLETHQHIKW